MDERLQKKILIVDDNPDVIGSVGTALQSRGFVVVIACDGDQALTLAQTENPDLIVLDLMLPGTNGLTVLKRLKRDGRHRLPVIMITGAVSFD